MNRETDELNVFGTPQEQLAAVNTAIYHVLAGGQSYRIGSRQLTRADLELLYDMQTKLQAQIANDQGSSLFADTVVAVFEGR